MVNFMENQRNIEFLARNFTKMSAEGKMALKSFLQNLVCLQNSGLMQGDGGGRRKPDLEAAVFRNNSVWGRT
jgi:hypothetical protein